MRKIQGIRNDGGYTELRIWLGPKRNLDGTENRPYRRSFGPYTLQNIFRAKSHMDLVRMDFKKGKLPEPDPKPLLFKDACDTFFRLHWEKRNRSAKALRNIKSKLNSFKKYSLWAVKPIHAFRPRDIEKYRQDRAASGKGLGTINQEQGILSSLFARLEEYVRREDIEPALLPPFNPCQYVEQPSTDHLKRERVASREELKKVHVWCSKNDPEMLEAIRRAIVSGLRKEDMRKLQGSASVRTLTGKTKKLVALPLDWSRGVDLKNWQKRWDRLRENVGMQDFHWHDWRHTGATMLKEIGVSEEIIREILAHANIQQTRDYINRKEERVRPALDALKKELDGLMPNEFAA